MRKPAEERLKCNQSSYLVLLPIFFLWGSQFFGLGRKQLKLNASFSWSVRPGGANGSLSLSLLSSSHRCGKDLSLFAWPVDGSEALAVSGRDTGHLQREVVT
jgi:hypothetical protein